MQNFFIWIGKNGSWFLLISLVIVLFRWRHLRGYLWYAALFVGLAVLGEATSYITARVLKVPNLYILHLYTIVEFNIIALFYRSFFDHFYPRALIPGIMLGFTTLAILNSAFVQPLTGYNTYARGLEGLLVIALALLCFYKMLTELTAKRIDRHPVFWINTGFLLYFAGSLFFLLLSNSLLTNPNRTLILTVFGLHALLMVVMHLLLSIGLWLSPRLR